MFENFLIRANLESLAAGLAAQKITTEDPEEITKIFEEKQHYALPQPEYGFTGGACAARGAMPG